MLLPLKFPPGIVRPGTLYDARGRWYDASLVRWHEGAMQPIGGWSALKDGTDADVTVSAIVRGIHAWRANDGTPYLALGTIEELHLFSLGTLTDVTPLSFSAGLVNATMGPTFGSGDFGEGLFGEGDPGTSALTEAQTWQMDNFGEDLVSVAWSDGQLLYTDISAGTPQAAALTNAPTDNLGVVVTPERFIMALGAGGDGRKVQWADQEATTTWTPASTNQAGDHILATTGAIMAGRRGRNETLIWTDVDLHVARYIGRPFVYRFDRAGSACGAVSRNAMTVIDGKAVWMGQRGFFVYDGFVKPLPCEVGDYVFNDMNRTQASKVFCDARTDFNEVIWYYPSSVSVENDRYVAVNIQTGHWMVGELKRTAGVDRGAFAYPMAVDTTGLVLRHEFGSSYLDVDGTTELEPYATSGPIEIGQGDNFVVARELIPDEKTLGGVQARFYAALYPTATETEHGPYSMANPTSVRFTGRQVRMKLEHVSAGWRVGTPRLDVVAGGKR